MRKGTIPTVVGLLLIAAALCITGYNLRDSARAAKASDEVLAQIAPMIREDAAPAEGRVINSIPSDPGDPNALPIEEIEYPNYVLNPNMDMPTVEAGGNDYIGVLYIVPLEKEFPIISEWSYERLNVAACRYSGSAYLDNMVICAHNYSMSFGRLRELKTGDKVRFTDMDGNQFRYKISEIETLRPSMVTEMTTGDWDLTLFTCTVGGQTRLALRCEREE